jgi:hypothetical protein
MTMNNTIKLKDVYGETKAYPICEKAQTFAAMLGTKTPTPAALQNIRKLGFEDVCVDAFGFAAGRLAA